MQDLSYCNFRIAELELFKEKIQSAQNIMILPHSDADGDALGSAGGLQKILQKLGKNAEIVCPDRPKINIKNVNFLVNSYNAHPDLIISVDCAAEYRFFTSNELKNIFLVNIDHHVSNTFFGNLNFVDGTAASACEVVTAIFWQMYGSEIFDASSAHPLLFGLLSDTQSFYTENTSIDTLKIATFLLSFGVDFIKLKHEVMERIPLKTFHFWNEILTLGQMIENKYLVLVVDQKFLKKHDAEEKSLEGFVNFVIKKIACEAVILIVEREPRTIKVSMRSRNIDVQKIASHFKGGGHVRAAGFTTKDNSIEALTQQIIQRLKQI